MKARRFLKISVSMAVAGMLAGCSMWSDGEGVPLDELDLTGEAPTAVALLGPDNVVITAGTPFRITLEGESSDNLRFSLKNGTLGISRDSSFWESPGGDAATVRVSMPAPESLTVAGSGQINSTALAANASVSVAGSGTIETPQIDVEKLDVSIAGSGDFLAGGLARALTVSVAGSGNARMEGLKSDRSDVNLAGSGDVAFASDGNVQGNILGSGNITITGTAQCKINTLGSGSVTCPGASEPTE